LYNSGVSHCWRFTDLCGKKASKAHLEEPND
jgi:hypothetical protein